MFHLDPISLALDPPRFVKTKLPARARDVRPPVRPLPELNGRAPIQLDRRKCGGIDLAYARRSETDLIATYPAGSGLVCVQRRRRLELWLQAREAFQRKRVGHGQRSEHFEIDIDARRRDRDRQDRSFGKYFGDQDKRRPYG